MASKRDRAVNWENEEKQLLRDVIKPYLNIIENKDLSTNTNKAKINAWAEITRNFNTANARPRDKKQIMNQWKCTKLSSKKDYTKFQKKVSKTGGGPPPSPPPPDVMEIVEMLPHEFEVDVNEFDVDGIKDLTPELLVEKKYVAEDGNSNKNNMDNDMKIIIEEVDLQAQAGTSNNHFTQLDDAHEVSQSSHIVPTPKRSAKKKEMGKSDSFNFSKSTFEDMHNFRVLENERLQKEHDLRMKNMVELQNQVMNNLKLQEEYLKKMLASTST